MADGTKDWSVVSRQERASGTYYALKVPGTAGSKGVVALRSKCGAVLRCISCDRDDCQHVTYIAQLEAQAGLS